LQISIGLKHEIICFFFDCNKFLRNHFEACTIKNRPNDIDIIRYCRILVDSIIGIRWDGFDLGCQSEVMKEDKLLTAGLVTKKRDSLIPAETINPYITTWRPCGPQRASFLFIFDSHYIQLDPFIYASEKVSRIYR